MKTNASDSRQVLAPANVPGIDLGLGYNSESLDSPILWGGLAFAGIKIERPPVGGISFYAEGLRVTSVREYFKSQDLGIAASARYLAANGNLSFNASYTYNSDQKYLYWYIDMVKIRGNAYLSSVENDPKCKALFFGGEGLEDLVFSHGREYIAGIVYGSAIRIIFEFRSESVADITSMSAHADASINALSGGGSVSGDVSSAIKHLSEVGQLKIKLVFLGVPDSSELNSLLISDFSNARANVEKYLDNSFAQQHGAARPLYLHVRCYSMHTCPTALDEDTLADCLARYLKARSEIDLISSALNNSFLDLSDIVRQSLVDQRVERESISLEVRRLLRVYVSSQSDADLDKLRQSYLKLDRPIHPLAVPPVPKVEGHLPQTEIANESYTPPIILDNLPPNRSAEVVVSAYLIAYDTPSDSMEIHAPGVEINGSIISLYPPDYYTRGKDGFLTSTNVLQIKIPPSGEIVIRFYNHETKIDGKPCKLSIRNAKVTVRKIT
jgi:hypothetical protein